ncbi:MAG: AAA family ATPase [Thermoplasmata archaeon]|nr:AAA family ATPase [Thermoplasmata archaeon]
MRLIVTVGMPGAGTDELADVARGLNLATLKMGDLVRDETRRRGMQITNANIARVAAEEREKHGLGIWAQRALPKITETKMLVNGCRSDSEITVFRHNFSDLFILGVYSSPETRYNRMIERARGRDGEGLQEFYERDRRELKWGIGNAFALVDGMLVNEVPLPEFRVQARTMLERILRKETD